MDTLLQASVRNYLDFVRSLIIVLSPEGKIVLANRFIQHLIGCSEEEMIGRDWFEQFIPKEKRQKSKNAFKALINGMLSSPLQYESSIQTKDGELLLIHWSHTVLKSPEGAVSGCFSSGEDVTEKSLLQYHLAHQHLQKRKELMSAILQAAEEERKEIAHELHDGVNQVLTVCKLLLDVEIRKQEASPSIEKVATTIQSAINDIRSLAHRLDPSELKDGGFYNAVKDLVHKVNATRRFRLRLKTTGVKFLHQLPPSLALHLFRILQEALTNITKHAGASQVFLTLTGSSAAVECEVRDNGKGFRKEEVRKGLGLRTIYSRAEAIGGKVYISSEPGEGTLLSIHIPLR